MLRLRELDSFLGVATSIVAAKEELAFLSYHSSVQILFSFSIHCVKVEYLLTSYGCVNETSFFTRRLLLLRPRWSHRPRPTHRIKLKKYNNLACSITSKLLCFKVFLRR